MVEGIVVDYGNLVSDLRGYRSLDTADGSASKQIQPHVESVIDLVFVDHSIGTQHEAFSMDFDDCVQ